MISKRLSRIRRSLETERDSHTPAAITDRKTLYLSSSLQCAGEEHTEGKAWISLGF